MNHKHNKEVVINKGIELFWIKGYHSLGVDHICKETGMTKGAFYNSFKSKELFLLTAIESYGVLISDHLQNHLSNDNKSAFDKLLTLYKEMLQSQPENNYKGCLVNNMMSEMAVSSTSVSDLTKSQFNKFVKTIEPTVKKAQQDNNLTDSINSVLLTELIHTTFFGLLTRSKSTKTSGMELMESFLHTLKNENI